MYAPTTQVIGSGLRGQYAPRLNVDIAGDMRQDFQETGKAILDYHNKRYQETSDFFDIQKEEMDGLNAALDGLEGKDYEYMMKNVLKSRDEMAKVFAGKKLKDYNTPEFQRQLYEIKKNIGVEVANSRATISAYKDVVNLTDKDVPHLNKGAVRSWLQEQMSLPPAEREANPIAFINSDPQFRNTADYAIKWVESQGAVTYENIIEKGGWATNSTVSVNRALYDKDGKVIITDASIDQMFAEQPWFKTAMENMARDPEENKALVDAGLTYTKDGDLRQFTKRYLETISALKNREIASKQQVKQRVTPRPTATDKKNQDIEQEAANFHKNLFIDPAQALAKYKPTTYKKEGSVSRYTTRNLGNGKVMITPYFWIKKGKNKVIEEASPDPFIIDQSNPNTSMNFLDWASKNSYPKSEVTTNPAAGASGVSWE